MEESAESNPTDAQTRQHIQQAAAACIRRAGYSAVTLPDIAAEAGLPLAAVEARFASKEAIATALVQMKIDELLAYMGSLPAGALADRYSQALSFAVESMAADREAVAAAFAHAMLDDSEFDLMSELSEGRLVPALERLVLDADDALPERQARDLAIALYTALMLVLIYWCYDRSPGQAATLKLLGLVRDLFAQLRPLYFLPMAPQVIARLAGIVQPPSEQASVGAAAQKDARDREHQDFDVHRD